MSVMITFACDGCDAKTSPERLKRQFHSFSGRGYGFGRYVIDSPETLIPNGWIMYDQIGCTYCPACTIELFGPQEHRG